MSQVSGNTGRVEDKGVSSDSTTLYWSPTEGDIGNQVGDYTNFTPEGQDGDIRIYATEQEAIDDTGANIIATITTNDGFFGTQYRTFNNKNFRFSAQPYPNGFISSPYQDRNGTWNGSAHVEETGSVTFNAAGWPNRDAILRVAGEWADLEYTMQWGTQDVEDGEMLHYKDGVCAFSTSDKKFIMSSSVNPNKFDLEFNYANDNKFSQGTSCHTDYVYLDDSFCLVVVAKTSQLNIDDTTSTTPFKLQPWPIDTWANNLITCWVQEGETIVPGDTVFIINAQRQVVSQRVIS